MLDETICHQVFDFTTPKTILKSKLFAFEYQIDVININEKEIKWLDVPKYQIVWTTSQASRDATFNSLEQFQLVDSTFKLFAPVCTDFLVSNTNMLV